MQQEGRECTTKGSQKRREKRQLPAVKVQLVQGKAK